MAKTEMSAATKMAILLASLEREIAVAVMCQMSPRCVQKVSAEIRSLGEIEPAVKTAVFDEFSSHLQQGVSLTGGEDLARSLLTEVVGDRDKADDMLEKAVGAHSRAFSSIVRVDGKDLAVILCKEQAATIAIVLSYLPAAKSAEIVSYLPLDLRNDVVSRLSRQSNSDPALVKRLERIFVDKVISLKRASGDQNDTSLGGPQFIADMFQHIDRSIQDELFNHLQQVSEELAEEVRERTFTFEDIAKLADPDIQIVLREVPMSTLMLALRGAPTAVYDKITNNMSKRARDGMVEEMELMTRVKRSEVEAEQRNVINTIRSLEAVGELDLSGADGEDDYV